MEVRMQPRSEAHQRCLSFQLEVDPPAHIMLYRDFLGNMVHHFDIAESHSRVKVTAQALVDLEPPPVPSPSDVGGWEALEQRIVSEDHWEMLLPSHFTRPTPLLEELARELHHERRGNPLEILLEMNQAIYRGFSYVRDSTKVDSPIDDALRSRQGVCQDFAHIMIALARQLGIPARYVSGYLFHGKDCEDRSPDSASHAWLEALVPGAGWVAFDPTNNLIGGTRHIRVAIGRDYADVPPTRGVYKGDATSELAVVVTVFASDAPAPEDLAPVVTIRSRPPQTPSESRFQHEQQQQ